MIFALDPYLVTPYRPFAGAIDKNDVIFAKCAEHPHRFLISPRSGDPQTLLGRLLTSPDHGAWEVWRGGTFVGILVLDRVVPNIDARLHFVFFDDELASKAPLLQEFTRRCFTTLGLQRLTFEAPDNVSTSVSFAKRKLGFAKEGVRTRAYHNGTRWCDLDVYALHAAQEA